MTLAYWAHEAIFIATLLDHRHEFNFEEVIRHFWREPLEGVVHAKNEVVLLERTHHKTVDLPIIQYAHEDYA
jgi:hypothetical protein